MSENEHLNLAFTEDAFALSLGGTQSGELGTVQTITIDGDVFPDSTTEKPFMEIWVNMPDRYRLGVTLSMKPEEFLQTVWVGKIASAMNRLREEYEARTK